MGKTVLLVKMNELAEKEGFHAISVEAHEGKTLPELLAPGLRKALLSLSTIESAKELGRRGLRVFRSFLNSAKINVADVEVGLGVSPEVGTADSGDIEADLPDLMLAIGQAAKAAGKPVALLIDELQYLSESELALLSCLFTSSTNAAFQSSLSARAYHKFLVSLEHRSLTRSASSDFP